MGFPYRVRSFALPSQEAAKKVIDISLDMEKVLCDKVESAKIKFLVIG
jgi:uncharacterized ubiquitin-like protein YukD